MRRFLAALAFLSRLPVPGAAGFDARDVGRATLLFPAVGALLGLLQAAAASALHGLPPMLAAVLLVALSALVTGALHLDGLADMIDGFGGGRTREDVLRIMRDHVIGAYGAVALILLVAVKVTALEALLRRGDVTALVLAPALARWASVPLARWLPYARAGGGLGAALTDHVGALEVLGATAIAGSVAVGLGGLRGAAAWGAVAALSTVLGLWCKRRIGGITGDTLGANTELAEAVVLVACVAAWP